MSDCHSLLPSNSTPLELDLEKLQCGVTGQPVPYRDLWNPDNCPVELLPWLAWSMSVDYWNDKWPQHIKRDVIKNSVSIHQIKGTQKAVEDSLAVLGLRVEVVEWWQKNPVGERGTMDLILKFDENIIPDDDALLGNEIIYDLVQQIKYAKRSCIHYTLTIDIDGGTTGITIAQSAQMLTHSRIDAEQRDVAITPSQPIGITVAQSSQMLTHSRIDAEQRDVAITPSQPIGINVAQSTQMLTHSRIDAEQRDVAITPSQPIGITVAMTAQVMVGASL